MWIWKMTSSWNILALCVGGHHAGGSMDAAGHPCYLGMGLIGTISGMAVLPRSMRAHICWK